MADDQRADRIGRRIISRRQVFPCGSRVKSIAIFNPCRGKELAGQDPRAEDRGGTCLAANSFSNRIVPGQLAGDYFAWLNSMNTRGPRAVCNW